MSTADILTVWTVGHSTRSAAEFLDILRAHDIEMLIDVRRFPGSRRLPQFSRDALKAAVEGVSIDYCWLPQLGGRRSPITDSLNDGWRHRAFRGYADHVASEEFAEGLFELLMLANGMHAAVMCAEVLWWRCHRRIVSDVLVSLGAQVIHVRDQKAGEPHRLAPPARIIRGQLSYQA